MMRWASTFMGRALALALTLLLGASISAGAGAQTFDGVLKAVDAAGRRIVVVDGKLSRLLKLSVPKGAQIRLGAKVVALKELSPGPRVWGWYDPKTRHASFLKVFEATGDPDPSGKDKTPAVKAPPSGQAGRPAAEKTINVWERTYAQRTKADRRLKPLAADSLVLPYPYLAEKVPPQLLAKGDRLKLMPLERIIWQIVPQSDKHAAYLRQREQLLGQDKPLELIRWCLANGLPVCAAFEARTMCRKIGDFRKREYKQYLPHLLRYTDTLQTRYSYPLPIEGLWYVAVDRSGHHRVKMGAAYAFDLVIRRGGRSYAGTGRKLTDHYCWGAPIIAQADGVVATVRDDHKDNLIGQMGAFNGANGVGVYYGGGVLGSYGHIQQGSAKVKVGQRVSAGDVLALVGNSGASGAPHLHFTMVDMGCGSLKGRFTYEVVRRGRGRTITGKALIEGVEVRNTDAWRKAPVSPPKADTEQ